MGLPGSGKTTLANELAPLLNAKRLNADEVRKEANDWDFSEEGRKRQAKRMADFAIKLKENAINYNNSMDPLTWIFDLLRAAGSQNLDLEQFGISSLKNYDPMKIRDEVNKELLDLSEAHHQRYFKKA